jgi:hypothetical protein
MSYWTPQALGALANSESSGRADLIHYPSGYTPQGVRSSASGLYGYLDSTWQTYAPQAGVDTTLYPRAYMAPASVQTQVALITPTWNWTCHTCNDTASSLARNPSNVSDTPASGATVATGPDTQVGAGATYDPATGQAIDPSNSPTSQPPSSTPTSPDTSSWGQSISLGLMSGFQQKLQEWITSISKGVYDAITTPLQNFFGQAINWFERGFLIVVGLVIAGVALWKLMTPEQQGAITRYVPVPI